MQETLQELVDQLLDDLARPSWQLLDHGIEVLDRDARDGMTIYATRERGVYILTDDYTRAIIRTDDPDAVFESAWNVESWRELESVAPCELLWSD